MRKCNIIKGAYINNHPVQQYKKTQAGFHGEIADKLWTMIQAPLRWLFIFVLTLKFPVDYPELYDNRLLVAFLKWFAERLGYKVWYRYSWVREQDGGLHPHYHIIFVVDGDCIYSGWGWLLIAQEIWASVLGRKNADGLIEVSDPEPFPLEHTPKYKISDKYKKYQVSYGMMIDNWASDADARREEVFYWICYFAKVYSKHSGTGCRSFGTSRF